MRGSSRDCTFFLVLALALVATTSGLQAETTPRKQGKRGPQAAVHTVPDGPGIKPPQAPPSDQADDQGLLVPFVLPTATRARMHDCGRKWQSMKMSGDAGDEIWRDFAKKCLAAKSGPFDK